MMGNYQVRFRGRERSQPHVGVPSLPDPLRRDHHPATEYRAARARAFAIWAEVTGAKAAA